MIVRLKRGKAKPLWSGHPWVYSGAVFRVEGTAAPGAFVAVIDDRGTLIGWGHHSPEAPIAVRLWAYAAPGVTADAAAPDVVGLMRSRLEEARARRARLGIPAAECDAYRLVNSEGDRMPGVVIDVFGDTAVLALGTPGVAAHQDSLVALIKDVAGVRAVERRISPDAARLESLPAVPEDEGGGTSRETPILLDGIRYTVDPVGGQKTGFYLDQVETRRAVAALARDRTVLDVCSFGGAFSLQALKGGATAAVAVDTSPRAQQMAEKAAADNGLEGFVFDRRDAFVALRERAAAGERYDVVVVDPPKFARGRRDLDGALQKYMRLNELALRCLAADGVLVSCSCSRHVSEAALERAVGEAAQRAGKVVHLVKSGGQAPDHPTLAGFPEGRYLKVLYFTASPRTA